MRQNENMVGVGLKKQKSHILHKNNFIFSLFVEFWVFSFRLYQSFTSSNLLIFLYVLINLLMMILEYSF